MRSSMAHLTYGKLYDLPAMQPRQPQNRRVYTPYTADELARIKEADAALIASLRKLAEDLDRAGALCPVTPKQS